MAEKDEYLGLHMLFREQAGRRQRKQTEKGLAYTQELKNKHLKQEFRRIQGIQQEVFDLLSTNPDKEALRKLYSECLSLWDEFFQARDKYLELLPELERNKFMCSEGAVHNDKIIHLKSVVEDWFSKNMNTGKSEDGEKQNIVQQTDMKSVQVFRAGSHVSRAGSHVSSVRSQVSKSGSKVSGASSTLSIAMIKEQQKRAELMTKAKAIKDRQRIEMNKLRIKMEEDEFNIQTEIAIAEARSQVLEDFVRENFDHDQQNHEQQSTVSDRTVRSNTSSEHEHVIPDTQHSPNQSNHTPETRHNPNQIKHEKGNLDPELRPPVPHYRQARQNDRDNVQENTEIASVMRLLKRPVTEITKFSGDPVQYPRFMRQFNSRIVMNCDNMDDVVCYLEQYTLGEAQKIVTGYSYLEARQAYDAIMREFDDRYGDRDNIACAYLKRALEWPEIRTDDGKSLDHYAIFLSECDNAIQSLDALRILEYPENMKRLVKKLPYRFHDKWRSVIQATKSRNHIVTFNQLVEFVKLEAKKANDPVYGMRVMTADKPFTPTRKPPYKQSNFMPKNRTFATGVTVFTGELKEQKKVEHEKQATTVDRGRDINQNKQGTVKAVLKPCIYCRNQHHGLSSCYAWEKVQYDDRIKYLRSKGLCFKCLRYGHLSKDCPVEVECSICKGRHNSMLHVRREILPRSLKQKDQNGTSACASSTGESTGAGIEDCTMAIIPVKVRVKNSMRVMDTYAFLDPGSSVSFCSETLMHQLGCSGRKLRITLDTMSSPCTMNTYEISGLEVYDLDQQNVVYLPKVYTKERMPVTSSHIPKQEDISRWPHLNDVHLPQLPCGIDLLIGNNVPDAYTPCDLRTGPRGTPHATKTRLGWVMWNVVRGNTESRADGYSVNRAEVVAIEDLNRLERLVKESINFDFPEKLIEDKKEKSVEDQMFVKKVKESIVQSAGHYQINLPFKKENPVLPDNHNQALHRLHNLKRKFEKNPKFHDDYKKFMSNLIDKGYAERVPNDDPHEVEGKIWYLPHHGVYHPHKPDKIRVVFDCSASHEGVSLNNQLLPGPDLTNNLIGILLRFRQENVAVMADIEAIFHQVQVPAEDRNFLRYYWWPDGNTDTRPTSYRMKVHLFGATSSPSCSNAALRQTADDNEESSSAESVAIIRKSFYVDDCLKSVKSEQEAVRIIKDVTELCQRGGFHLTKWICNSRHVMESIPKEEQAKGVKSLRLDHDELPTEKALGVEWDVETDMIGFRKVTKENPPTRRGILSTVSSVYDSIGLAAPFILPAKIILQDLCKQNFEWDQEVKGDNLKKWQGWIRDLSSLTDLKVPRCYKPEDFGQVDTAELHLFSDASDKGYGVAAYIRLKNNREEIHCSLMYGKARVAPLKKVTIPRLELTAATLSVRTSALILKELEFPVSEVYYWTDSMAVIRYISNESTRFHTFVANRLAVIRDSSDVSQWKYVDSRNNPADGASRGIGVDKTMQTQTWFYGPEFLWKPTTDWPEQPDGVSTVPDDDPEKKKVVNSTILQEPPYGMEKLLNHYSTWIKLKRAVGWLILFNRNLKESKSPKRPMKMQLRSRSEQRQKNEDLKRESVKKSIQLTVEILQESEEAIIRFTQSRYFRKELKALKKSEKSRKSPDLNKSRKLNPILVDEIMRVGGRLEKADIPYEAKHPIVLPQHCSVSKLIVEDTHKNVGHQGKNTVLNAVRQKYWIVGASKLIKRHVSKCVVCRKYQARAADQMMSDLPRERLIPDEPPFSHVGMDYFGPFYTKRGRKNQKRYGVIFTCLSIRAVHLEVASSLDTSSCINAIRRFISRRGPVKSIRSDNGTNLVGSERELKEEMKKLISSKLKPTLQKVGIHWRFNPPASSHFGGVWERLIRSVRKILYSLMHEQAVHLDDEALQTLFCEVEAIMNDRPITKVSGDPDDLIALTPNHLLLLQPGEDMPPGIFDKSDNYTKRRWRQVQYISDVFWKRWSREYLTQLQERQKWTKPRRNAGVGDIVLIVDNTQRNSWALGRVQKVFPDKKGFVRFVEVKTETSVLQRSIDKLCLVLEGESI